jgi:predicted metal-dependent peptidase
MRVKFSGRGGTIITPVLNWASENKPQLLMVFTDGGFGFYDTQTKVDTIWLIHGNPNWTAPFGKVIHYEV